MPSIFCILKFLLIQVYLRSGTLIGLLLCLYSFFNSICLSFAGVYSGSKFAGTLLYTWVERGAVRVKCLNQEYNTMSPAKPRTQTSRSLVEHMPPLRLPSMNLVNPYFKCEPGRWEKTLLIQILSSRAHGGKG